MLLPDRSWKCRTEIDARGSKAVFRDEYSETMPLEKVLENLIDGSTFGVIKKIEISVKNVDEV